MQEQNAIEMKVSREVILDLLPLYTQARPARHLRPGEEYLRLDAELRSQYKAAMSRNWWLFPPPMKNSPSILNCVHCAALVAF